VTSVNLICSIAYFYSFFRRHSVQLSPFFFLYRTASSEIYTLSLHDALPISSQRRQIGVFQHRRRCCPRYSGLLEHAAHAGMDVRSEEHTSELQSRVDLVCRLLLEKKKKKQD